MVSTRTWDWRLGSLGTTVRITRTGTDASFKTVRSQISKDLKFLMRDTANQRVVPHVDARAHFVRTITHQGVIARNGTRNSVYITTANGKRKLKAAAGYIEFGGGIKTPVGARITSLNGGKRPQNPDDLKNSPVKRRRGKSNRRHAGAVMTPMGPRALVTKTRVFKGKRLVQQGVKESQGAFCIALEDRLVKYFEDEGFYHNK